MDLKDCLSESTKRLSILKVKGLSRARQINVLYRWLSQNTKLNILASGHSDGQFGGIVAKHLAKLGAKVTFTSIVGDDHLGKFVKKNLVSAGIKFNCIM